MLIIVNKNVPEAAIKKLGEFGEVVPFSTRGIVYDAVSGHPDVFFAPPGDLTLVAPNLPEKYKSLLSRYGVSFAEGSLPVGSRYPATARYNAVVTGKYFVHNLKISDPQLIAMAQNKIPVHVTQGYTRCNLIAVDENRWITSDRGIYKTLNAKGGEVLFVRPQGIVLPGFQHGFIGGTCGIADNKLFLLGSLKYHTDGEKIRNFVKKTNLQIIELYSGPLFDGGSILFF